jgi:D-alanyl-D-alanine carboxypeptidase (penicillin-binding protein 5/6)
MVAQGGAQAHCNIAFGVPGLGWRGNYPRSVPNGASSSRSNNARAARLPWAVAAVALACLFAAANCEPMAAAGAVAVASAPASSRAGGKAGAPGQTGGSQAGTPGAGSYRASSSRAGSSRAGSSRGDGLWAGAKLPSAPPAKGPLPPSRSYVLVDVGTGNVLAGYREHLKVRPASLTKVLTALIAISYLGPAGRVSGTTQSETAYPNQVGMEKGTPWPLSEVLQSLLVYSANDAAYAIADRIGGSLAGFVPIMERSAREMGMSDDPVLNDPAGLDGTEGFRGGNFVSARDLAIAGRDLLHVPELAAIVRERGYHFVDPAGKLHWLPSMDYVFLDSYPGAVGIKTGYTDLAGACIMAAATRHGRTMLAVVTDGYNPQQTAMDLLDQGFATPVATEQSGDRLPPVALPYRPASARVAGGSERPGTHRAGGTPALRAARLRGGSNLVARASKRPGELARPGVARGASRSGSRRPGRHKRADEAPRGGLSEVLGTLLGQALLAVTALAALVALGELVRTDRARRGRRTRAYALPPGRAARVAAALSTGRRRRERLIASYTRHERPAGFKARG